MSIVGNKYRYWYSHSKECEPEIITVEAWPTVYGPARVGLVLLRLPNGSHEAIHEDEFFKKRHQRLSR